MEAEVDNDGVDSSLIFGETAPCFDNIQFLDTGIIDLDSYSDEDYKHFNEDNINQNVSEGSASLQPITVQSTVVARPMCIKLVDCYKFPWYFDQSTKDIIERKLASNSVNMNVNGDTMDVISEEVHNHVNVVEYTNTVIYSDNNVTLSVKANISQQRTDVSSNKFDKSISKETDTKCVHKTLNAHRRCDPVKRLENTKKRNDIDLLFAINQRNKTKADPKKNIGYIGMKVKRITPKKAIEVEAETQKAEEQKEQNGLKTAVSKALHNVDTIITPVLENAKTIETDRNEKDFKYILKEGTPAIIVNENDVSKALYSIGTVITPVLKNVNTSEKDLKYILAEGVSTKTVNEMTKIAEEIIERVKTTPKKEIDKSFTLKQKCKSEVCKMTEVLSVPHHLKTYKKKNAKQLKNLAQGSVFFTNTSDINIKITENKTHTQDINTTPVFHTHDAGVQNMFIPTINESIENNANSVKRQAKDKEVNNTTHKRSKPSQSQSKKRQQCINNNPETSRRSKHVCAEIHNIETTTLPLNTIVMKTAKTVDAKINVTANNSNIDVTHYNALNVKNLVSKSKISSRQDYFARSPPIKEPRKQSLKSTSATTNRNINNYIKNKADLNTTPNVALETPNSDNNTQMTIRRNESNNRKQENTNTETNFQVQPHQFTYNSASVIRPTQTSSNQTQGKNVRSPLRSHILYDPQAKPTSSREALQFQIAPHSQLYSQYIYQQSGAPTYTPWYPSLTGEMAHYLAMSNPIQNTHPQMSNVPSTVFGPIAQHKGINEDPQRNKQAPLINWNNRLTPSVYEPIYKPMEVNTAQKCSHTPRMTSNHRLTRFFNGQPVHDSWSPNFPPPSILQPPLPSMPPPQPPPPPLEPFPEYQYTATPTKSERNSNNVVKKIRITDYSHKTTNRKDVVRINNVIEGQPAVSLFKVQNGLDTSMPRMKNPIGNDELSQISSGNSKQLKTAKRDFCNLKTPLKIRTSSKNDLPQHNEPRKNIFDINEILLDPLRYSKELTKRAMKFKHNKVTCTAVPKAPQVKSNQQQPIKEHTMISEPSLDQVLNLKAQPLKVIESSNSHINDNKAIKFKKSSAATHKPGPLSKKRENEVVSRVGPYQNNKESVPSGIGYSPPVLPIPPTYEKPEIYNYFNKVDADKSNMDSNDIMKKCKQTQDGIVDIDMKRASERRIDEALNNINNETFKKYTVDVSRRASNVDSDAGYDSDIKL